MKRWNLLFSWCKKANPVCENNLVNLVKIRTLISCEEKPSEGVCSEREHACLSSWTSSSASHKLQVGEQVEFQVAVQSEGCGHEV
jgi:hypothetical protein